MSEKNVVRRSRIRRECWTWSEKDEPPFTDDVKRCTRAIDIGEQYMSSTIFPGHDSGFADGGYERRIKWVNNKITWFRVWVDGKPMTSSFCLPCANRWTNLRESLPENLRTDSKANA